MKRENKIESTINNLDMHRPLSLLSLGLPSCMIASIRELANTLFSNTSTISQTSQMA